MTSNFIIPSPREFCAGFIHLLYPELCVACDRDIPLKNACFCLKCRQKITPFDLSSPGDNEFTDRFWGRLPIQYGVAGFHLSRKNPIHRAIHKLKYHNKPEIAEILGRELGQKLKVTDIQQMDGIIPVPLHPAKERARGYNQSLFFAKGLAESMQIPVYSKALERKKFTATQTKKNRMERFENVGEVFAIRQADLLEGKHLLLVDDVMTTGATLEMCGQQLLQVQGASLSLATMAIADL